ncbi:MAG TPA: hypothetical protein VJN18_32205 [Polyangiaceae bacterium]|nr:hypothetical protein [Polyangiaceae bacterium]
MAKNKRSPRKEKKVYYVTYVFTDANGETTERDTGPFTNDQARSQAKECASSTTGQETP